MNVPLVMASVLMALLGAAHSYLGERYILIRLFRRGNLSELFRRPEFTRQTLRLAWHITTVLAFGLAMILLVLALPLHERFRSIGRIISVTVALCGVMALILSRARHLSWIIFFTIAGLVWVAQ
jgi:hypothetical protein